MFNKFDKNVFTALWCILFWTYSSSAQTYPDHIGDGNYIGVEVKTSDANLSDTKLYGLTGEQLFPDAAAASRFLAQATLGHNWEDIAHTQNVGIQAWIKEQMDMPYATTYLEKVDEVYNFTYFQSGMDTSVVPLSKWLERDFMFHNTFYEKIYTEEDMLRQRIAFALNQIIVTASSSNSNKSSGYAQFYDILYTNAFGNFRDILYQISTHSVMGNYLTYMDNKKSDYGLLSFPDENYAREIMQLYSIGLWELNTDGTAKLDANGNRIPTYNNIHIQELAKVFTGLTKGDRYDETANYRRYELARPLVPEERWHERTAKTLIDGSVLAPGKSTLEDVSDAIDMLFNHPNVGPFIGRRLIQHTVKSNPSPAYIKRVATAFNNNGNGVRGDMGAVVKAILLDPEARDCTNISTDKTNGKLIQPVERFTKLFKAFDISTPSNKFYIEGRHTLYDFKNLFEQDFFRSTTVFNFFLPDYAEPDFAAPAGLVSPEFQIQNTNTTINYANIVENVLKSKPFNNNTVLQAYYHDILSQNPNDEPVLDFSDEINTYNNQGLNALLNRLDILLCRGQLTNHCRSIIESTINQYEANVAGYSAEDAVKDAIYFIMVSDFPILK